MAFTKVDINEVIEEKKEKIQSLKRYGMTAEKSVDQ